MVQVAWTTQAVDDLKAISEFIGRDSRSAADLMVRRLIDAVSRLEDFPLSGRIVPEVGDERVREVIRGAYRIVHRVRENSVEILAVHHGARLLRREDFEISP